MKERQFKKFSEICSWQFVVIALGSLSSGGVYAQPGHGGHHQPADITGIAAETETIPTDDTVLELAPSQVELQFPVAVRLVKLTLRNELRDWVDIDFRYNPRLGQHFEWELPTLNEAAYYTVDWAALDRNERLVRGSFHFAFGAGAEPPSVLIEAEQLRLQQNYGDPDIRYVAPPRTQIIIDQDPPSYDPPFIINLEEQDTDNP